MAGDEAEHSKTEAEPGLAPDFLQETPVNGAENQPQGEPAAPDAIAQSELETTGAPFAEAGPAESPETQAQGETPIPTEEVLPESAAAPGRSIPVTARSVPGKAAKQPKSRSRFPALAATALAGGLLGFGGTYALRSFEDFQTGGAAAVDNVDKSAALNAKIDAIGEKGEAAAAAARMALADLETRVAAAESAANKAVETAALAEAGLRKELESRPPGQEPPAGSNPPEVPGPGPLNERIGTIEQKLTALESALAAPKAELRAPQQDRENPAAKQVSLEHAIAIVTHTLLRRLESGRPFPDELAALENLGVPADALAPLRAIAAAPPPDERHLAVQFTALAPAIIASDPANQPGEGEGILDRVSRHAKGLVHIRRVGETENTDTEGLVTRIEHALAGHDLEAAYKLWNDLPGAAKTKSERWGEAAKARLDALNAARSIEAGAVAVLGKPKS